MPVYAADPAAMRGMAGPLRFVAPPDYGPEPLYKVHTRAYLQFLSSYRSGTDASRAQALQYLGDRSDVMEPGLWSGIQRSAHSAVAAALWVSRSDADGLVACALSYPNGQHAHRGQARLGCYVNNQAVAVNTLLQSVERVAVLSMGPIHADGVQAVFYERADVMTISLHQKSAAGGDIAIHAGLLDERGAGIGYGYNLNFSLSVPLCDAALLRTLENVLGALQDYRVQAIVLSLHHEVRNWGGQVGRELGERIRALALPTVVMIESSGPEVKTLFEAEGFFLDFLSMMT